MNRRAKFLSAAFVVATLGDALFFTFIPLGYWRVTPVLLTMGISTWIIGALNPNDPLERSFFHALCIHMTMLVASSFIGGQFIDYAIDPANPTDPRYQLVFEVLYSIPFSILCYCLVSRVFVNRSN